MIPVVVLSEGLVVEKYRILKAALPDAEIFYAMKANPEPRIVKTLLDEGCGVEVTSSAEFCPLIEAGLHPDRIISSNPIKQPTFLANLHAAGVRRMVFDSTVEVDKIARYAPNRWVTHPTHKKDTGAIGDY